jgi:Cellulase (glycosyl hydrolase family 5)
MKRLFIAILLVFSSTALAQSQKWSEEKANDWYARQPWLVGSNYIPAYAVNQLDMWQADTFDLDRINLEFIWAENLGMNTMRVFLHDLLWKQDPSGFRKRIDRFLGVAKKHHIKPIFVLLDSSCDPFPAMFHQRPPRPGVHNSRWAQSPGATALANPKEETRILEYVQNIVLAFADDDRILAWDVWNEPDNLNQSTYGREEQPNKLALVTALLPKVFDYVRSGRPTQPLTSGLWQGDWSSPDKLTPIEKIQVEQSDIISFHNYGKPDDFEKRVAWLQQYKRPVLCTEYLARPLGSTFEGILPIAKKYKVAAYNWGLVAGKTQTWLPWDSWQHPYTDRQPAVWFQDIFRTNGVPYSQQEVDFIKQTIGDPQVVKTKKKGSGA